MPIQYAEDVAEIFFFPYFLTWIKGTTILIAPPHMWLLGP